LDQATRRISVELSKKILASVNNNLNELAKLSVNDLIEFKGIVKQKLFPLLQHLN